MRVDRLQEELGAAKKQVVEAVGLLRERDAQLAAAVEALQAYSKLDNQVANCDADGHEPEYAPETCEVCFPFCDDARLKMRAAVQDIGKAAAAHDRRVRRETLKRYTQIVESCQTWPEARYKVDREFGLEEKQP